MNRRRLFFFFFFANCDRNNPKCRLSVPANQNQPIHYSGQIHDVSRISYASFKETEAHGTIEVSFSAPGSSVSTSQMMHCSTYPGQIHDVLLRLLHFKGRQRRDSSDKIANGPQAFFAVVWFVDSGLNQGTCAHGTLDTAHRANKHSRRYQMRLR